MELPKEHLDSLKLCVTLSDKSFKTILKRALLDGTDPSKREHVSSLQVKCPDVPAETLVGCHAALLATFLEHVRLCPGGRAEPAAGTRLSAALQTAGWPGDRQAALLSLSAQASPPARHLLATVGHGPARLVDIRWREVATVQSSLAGVGEEVHFELTLVTLPPGGKEEELTVGCSRHQLQEVLAELRQAGRAMQSLADGTVTPPPPPPPPPSAG